MAKGIQLNVSESELLDLQKFYLQELEKAEKRVQEIKQTLAKLKLGSHETLKNVEVSADDETSEEGAGSRGRRKKKNKTNRKKPRWSEFIIDLLKSKSQLMRVGTIIEEAIHEFDIEDPEKKSTEQAIYNSLNRLRNVNKEVISYTAPGRKGSYYGLKDWFVEEGKLKEEFEERIA